MSDYALMESLMLKTAGISITATFANHLPDSLRNRIVITQIGAVFSFSDPNKRTEKNGPINTSLRTGESDILYSMRTVECCDEVFGTMEVNDLNRNDRKVISAIYKEGPDICHTHAEFELILKPKISSKDYKNIMNSESFLDLLELKVNKS